MRTKLSPAQRKMLLRVIWDRFVDCNSVLTWKSDGKKVGWNTVSALLRRGLLTEAYVYKRTNTEDMQNE